MKGDPPFILGVCKLQTVDAAHNTVLGSVSHDTSRGVVTAPLAATWCAVLVNASSAKMAGHIVNHCVIAAPLAATWRAALVNTFSARAVDAANGQVFGSVSHTAQLVAAAFGSPPSSSLHLGTQTVDAACDMAVSTIDLIFPGNIVPAQLDIDWRMALGSAIHNVTRAIFTVKPDAT